MPDARQLTRGEVVAQKGIQDRRRRDAGLSERCDERRPS